MPAPTLEAIDLFAQGGVFSLPQAHPERGEPRQFSPFGMTHVESVRIKSTAHPEFGVQFFRCNKWLAEKELSVELQPSPLPDYLK
ncbi:MAG TPA: hypothetical protein VFN35_15095 [Ktedonobacteraceae bacterium]|nr:hypothetical protein [Ktedonobacteraceae bacterium]